MAKYNGHRNWDYWNVSLWINNDENLCRTALNLVRSSANRTEAAGRFMALVRDGAIDEVTPDGARYSVDRVRRAMEGMEKENVYMWRTDAASGTIRAASANAALSALVADGEWAEGKSEARDIANGAWLQIADGDGIPVLRRGTVP